jgi:hypothetical protein
LYGSFFFLAGSKKAVFRGQSPVPAEIFGAMTFFILFVL